MGDLLQGLNIITENQFLYGDFDRNFTIRDPPVEVHRCYFMGKEGAIEE